MPATCSSCRWWRTDKQPGLRAPDVHVCALTQTGDDYGRPNEPTTAKAVAEFGYYAVLHTEADFGCNQWQEQIARAPTPPALTEPMPQRPTWNR